MLNFLDSITSSVLIEAIRTHRDLVPALAEPSRGMDQGVAAIEAHVARLDAAAIGFDDGRARHDHEARMRDGIAVLEQLAPAGLAGFARQDHQTPAFRHGCARPFKLHDTLVSLNALAHTWPLAVAPAGRLVPLAGIEPARCRHHLILSQIWFVTGPYRAYSCIV